MDTPSFRDVNLKDYNLLRLDAARNPKWALVHKDTGAYLEIAVDVHLSNQPIKSKYEEKGGGQSYFGFARQEDNKDFVNWIRALKDDKRFSNQLQEQDPENLDPPSIGVPIKVSQLVEVLVDGVKKKEKFDAKNAKHQGLEKIRALSLNFSWKANKDGVSYIAIREHDKEGVSQNFSTLIRALSQLNNPVTHILLLVIRKKDGAYNWGWDILGALLPEPTQTSKIKSDFYERFSKSMGAGAENKSRFLRSIAGQTDPATQKRKREEAEALTAKGGPKADEDDRKKADAIRSKPSESATQSAATEESSSGKPPSRPPPLPDSSDDPFP